MSLLIILLRKINKITLFSISTSSNLNIRFRGSISSDSSNSSSSSDSDGKKVSVNKDAKQKSEEALKKLNVLLKQIIEEDMVNSAKALNLAQPRNKRIQTEVTKENQKQQSKTTEVDMIKAVKEVAESVGGDDVKKIESELLMKLLTPIPKQETQPTNLTDIIKGMIIDRSVKSSEELTRAQHVKVIMQKERLGGDNESVQRKRKSRLAARNQTLITEKIDLFGAEKLSIFNIEDQNKRSEGPQNTTWEKLHKKELKLTITQPPSNYFQQMIQWTEQGKLWLFPIDNEQGMEREQNVYFTEHIFLEKHLEPWCPKKGPLRHFMELVCVGLSKNPYLTVDAKKEHIEWYKNYFEEKKQLLQETGALPKQDLNYVEG